MAPIKKSKDSATSNAADRMAIVDQAMRRHRYQQDALIEVLHTAQEAFGYLDDETLMRVARGLRLPLSRVHGVATFYHFFSRRPPGQHRVVVCLGTPCYVKGAANILSAVSEEMGIAPGSATPDGRCSLEVTRCFGASILAPAGMVDGEVVAHMTPEDMQARVKGLMSK